MSTKFRVYLSRSESLVIEADNQSELYKELDRLDSREMDNLTGRGKWTIDEIDTLQADQGRPADSVLSRGLFLHPRNVDCEACDGTGWDKQLEVTSLSDDRCKTCKGSGHR